MSPSPTTLLIVDFLFFVTQPLFFTLQLSSPCSHLPFSAVFLLFTPCARLFCRRLPSCQRQAFGPSFVKEKSLSIVIGLASAEFFTVGFNRIENKQINCFSSGFLIPPPPRPLEHWSKGSHILFCSRTRRVARRRSNHSYCCMKAMVPKLSHRRN